MNGIDQQHNSLSFHALRAKFQSNHHHHDSIKKTAVAAETMIHHQSEIIVVKKKNNSTIPRRVTAVAKNISDLSDHFPLKRNHNSSNSDLPTSKTTPSLWSSSNSCSTAEEEEEEDNRIEHSNSSTTALSHSNSTLGIRAVPRTGSFVTELSKRLAQSEKKGEPVSHIIPLSILSMRRSAPNLERDEGSSISTISESSSLLVPPAPPLPPTLPMTTSMHHIVNNRKSVPTSTSSPSLTIPPAIKRSTTGTSVHSMASSSNSSISTNQSTVSSNKRNNWHFTHWFSHPPLPSSMTTSTTINTLSDDHREQPAASALKRARVIQELIFTEKNYQTDMELIQEIYYDAAHEAFSKIEIKHIFINLLEIIAFEKDFIQMLDTACDDGNNDITIGIAFSIMMDRMDQIYGDYCKKHEDAVCKIQELSSRPNVQAFFSKCKDKIQGRTMCWDLPSLLIKPVQRVLKYPLLLREIVASTPENHPDYEQLVMVTHEIQQMADHINEIKRRKDLVEQLISDKKKIDRNVVQGINKRFTRRVHRKKQSASTHDTLFDDLYRQFELRQEIARQFERGVQEWVLKVKQNVHALSDLVHSLEIVYGDSDGIGLRSMRAFKQLVFQLEANSVETIIQESVYDRIEAYLKLFKNPSHIIQKRNRKLIDYDRARHLISKGEVPDKQLQVSVEAYISLNAYLLDELPTFLSLTHTYFDIIISESSRVQSTYWRKSGLEWKTLTIELLFGKEHTWSSIESDYNTTMKRIQPRINEILSKPHESQGSGYSLQQIPSLISSIEDNHQEDNVSLHVGPTIPSPLSLNEKTVTPMNSNKKYDSLFSESQPVFQCVALVDYESPERLQVHEGDLIQIWLPTSAMSSDNATTSTENTAATEWWYGSLAKSNDQIYGWLPSTICEKI